ncbi:MAG: hypothetical protein JZU53_06950 [Paludibacter sp.]|nr:hypothetical protein [Paludibacter sp.]
MAEIKDDTKEVIEDGIKAEEVKKTNRELFGHRLSKDFPDLDEDEQYGNHLKKLDEVDRVSSAHAELQKKLTENPKAALMLGDIMDGKHPAVAIKRYYSTEELEVNEDDENYEALITAERERIADAEGRKQLQEEYEQNLLNSQADVEEFCKEKQLSESEFEDHIETVIGMVNDLLSGKLNKELLKITWYGRNYESDMADAEERGSVKERNKKHEAEQLRLKGDGLPSIRTSSTEVKKPQQPVRQNSRYDRGDIWGRKQ